MKYIINLGYMALTLCLACSANKKTETPAEEISNYSEFAEFNSDSAYCHVSRQVEMGPRVPGTEGHAECTAYITKYLRNYCADTVILQSFEGEAFNGDILPLTNIIAKYNPDAQKRILLAAHYDTRPWGDNDPSSDGRQRPIPGANDGASGVAVLLEIARQLQNTRPQIGVDLIFFDGEDYGNSASWGNADATWCIGSQYWANNKPYGNSVKPEFGVVLDMVGGKNAKFHRESMSDMQAKNINDKIWDLARRSGMGARFVNSVAGSIIDDHLQVNRAGIPAVVIIECNNPRTQSFNPTWHTHSDNMSNIDRQTLDAVGQTMLNLIYEENAK